MIVFFVYNILIFNYKDTKNYRDYQLFKRISYPELRSATKARKAEGEATLPPVRCTAEQERRPAILRVVSTESSMY